MHASLFFLFILFAHSYQKAAERGGYGDERYEKLEFQQKVAEHYKVLHDASWKVMNCFYDISFLDCKFRY
jgi:thymidylate kinase